MSSEAISDSNSNRYLERLDDVYLDPVISGVFKKMRLYNELLARQFVSSDQINEIMNELDDDWRSLMGTQASLTGYVSFLTENIEGAEGVPRRDYYEDEDIIFHGVLPIEAETFYSTEGGEDLHTYLLKIVVEREGISPNGGYVRMRGNAALDDIISLEFKASISKSRAQSWLEHYHEDVLEDVEMALLNQSAEECEMIMRLVDMTVDAYSTHDGDEDLILRSSQALQAYTNSLFSFDKLAPYEIELQGDVWMMVDGVPKGGEVDRPLRSLATIDKLLWLAIDGENTLRPHLDLKLMWQDKDTKLTHLLVPLIAVRHLLSVRHQYFVGYEDAQ